MALFAAVPTGARAQDNAAPADAAAPAEGGAKAGSLSERAGYAFGVAIGRQLADTGAEIDLKQFTQAVSDMLAGKPSAMSEDDIRATFQEVQAIAQAKAAEASQMQAESGKKFLDENGKKEGVKTTASGLQYEVLTEGDGSNPAATDEVTVHYRGTLIDGKEFDSSYGRGEPATFPLNGVIKGWTEGVQLMKKGAKYRFFIPSELGYGERGAGADIPPHSTLVFEVELLKINGQ